MIRKASANAITPATIGSKLHRGDEARRVADDAQDGPRAAAALLGELLDPRPPGGDQAVLGRHEVAVQQDQHRHGEEFERKDHVCAPSGGRLGMTSSSNRIYGSV
jgi:hypothetical protein